MQLSEFFSAQEIVRDGIFQDLGYSSHSGHKLLTFCDNINYLESALANENVVAIIVKEDMKEKLLATNLAIVVVDAPRKAFFQLYEYMRDNKRFITASTYGVDPSAKIAASAIVSKRCYIGKNSVISDNVVIKDDVFIGDNCFVDVGVIVGSEGILYSYDENEDTHFIQHAGRVVIEHNVTLLSNAVVVRSVFPNMPTKIGHHSIIGIATTIGHEASIGANCKILGNCVIAKNVEINTDTTISSSSVVRENVKIGSHVSVKAGSVVVKDVADNQSVSGNFALDHRLHIKDYFKKQRG